MLLPAFRQSIHMFLVLSALVCTLLFSILYHRLHPVTTSDSRFTCYGLFSCCHFCAYIRSLPLLAFCRRLQQPSYMLWTLPFLVLLIQFLVCALLVFFLSAIACTLSSPPTADQCTLTESNVLNLHHFLRTVISSSDISGWHDPSCFKLTIHGFVLVGNNDYGSLKVGP